MLWDKLLRNAKEDQFRLHDAVQLTRN